MYVIQNLTAIYNTLVAADDLGARILLASDSVFQNVQAPIPNNQWTLEERYWFNIVLAVLQMEFVKFAAGTPPQDIGGGLRVNYTRDTSPETEAICVNQKIRSGSEYQNFSVLGLACIFGFSGLIIILSVYIETLVSFFQKKWNKGLDRRIRWMADSNFQIQRIMYENSGYGEWEGHMDVVPTAPFAEDLESPIELKDGKFGLSKKLLVDQVAQPSNQPKVEVSEIEMQNLSSRTETESSFGGKKSV
ncbi:hypothetical protein EG329_013590 [Mollisiaceae sp. DMI_Dod_QoI]|nr:hypothetical protein EG329_013590 [Helotiales sp. DMI_Dod_QoI]